MGVCLSSLTCVLVCMCVHAVEWNERCVKQCEYIVLPFVHPNSMRFFSDVIMAFCLLFSLIAKLICTYLKDSAYLIFALFHIIIFHFT